MRQPPRQLRLSRGIGLLDALIALALLAFGMLAMTRFQGHLVTQATESQTRQVASQLAAEHLSTVLVDVRNAACYTLPRAGVCANADAASRSSAWADRVAASLPAPVTAEAALDAASGRMTVTLTWLGKDSGEIRRLENITDVRP
jgi:Tfp pilus assembly protein PilV